MCSVCGCGSSEIRFDGKAQDHSHDHAHHHADDHTHDHVHPHAHDHAVPMHSHAPDVSVSRKVQIETDILAKNDAYAAENRRVLLDRGIFALNFVSAPGAGKTTLLVNTILGLQHEFSIAVIEGDQETSHDAERIRKTGVPALQINTGKGCHLDAHMVGHAIKKMPLEEKSLLFIENVGNLVCPAAFALGEAARVVILSVAEGEEKPLKYPDIFASADLLLINKADLLPYLRFDLAAVKANAKRVNPQIEILCLSAEQGDGMTVWFDWLRRRWIQVSAAQGCC